MENSAGPLAIQISARELPALFSVDVAVVGGSLAGVAAALRLREAGLDVAVIEPRTYLGREMTATLRPWLTVPETDRFWHVRRQGTFYYVEAIAWCLEELAHPDAIPILRRLHTFPPLRNQVSRSGFQTDFFEERQALLALCIARAAARCGDLEGIRTLIDYLEDIRSLLRRNAHANLVAIRGED